MSAQWTLQNQWLKLNESAHGRFCLNWHHFCVGRHLSSIMMVYCKMQLNCWAPPANLGFSGSHDFELSLTLKLWPNKNWRGFVNLILAIQGNASDTVAGETQEKESLPWIRCASGNVLKCTRLLSFASLLLICVKEPKSDFPSQLMWDLVKQDIC